MPALGDEGIFSLRDRFGWHPRSRTLLPMNEPEADSCRRFRNYVSTPPRMASWKQTQVALDDTIRKN
jgi:hypothetical protein